MKKILCFMLLFFAFSFALFFSARDANAATLYFNPSSGNFSVGNILTTSVLVNTEGQAINNAEAVINFPTELLDVISINKTGSIFTLWVEEPAFSNSAGTITFNGGLATPGFNGTAGKIVNIVFRVKSAGSASVIFSSAAVRANDGQGTDILQAQTGAQFNLISEERPIIPLVETDDFVLGAPSAPKITSSTHPDSDKWYNDSNPVFSWDLPDDVDAVETLVSRSSGSNPTILYIPPIEKKAVSDMEDGSWYFHLRFRNENGWGAVTHFRFQIDTEAPVFSLREIRRDDPTDPRARFSLGKEDELSGIDYYEIQIDGVEKQVWKDDGAVFVTEALDPGTHEIVVRAFDKAGNFSEEALEFNIAPLAKPVITKYKEIVETKEPLVVEGFTDYANSQVLIWVGDGDTPESSYLVEVDENGNFTFDTANKVIEYDGSSQGNLRELKLRGGNYNLWAQVIDERGAKSELSESVVIQVEGFSFMEFGRKAALVLSILLLLVVLTILLIGAVLWGWYKILFWNNRLKKEVMVLGRTFRSKVEKLKDDVNNKMAKLEKLKTKGQGGKKKKSLIKKLEKNLEEIEEFLEEEESKKKSKKKKKK